MLDPLGSVRGGLAVDLLGGGRSLVAVSAEEG